MHHKNINELVPADSPTPLISVIVANYNNANYLPVCIDSILSQTYPNIEIVIADDSSTDDSATVIGNYARRHANIRALYHSNNVGVAENRHDGICSAKGDFLTTLDADDYYYDKRKLERELALIQHYRDSGNENIIAFSNFCHVNADGDFIKDVITPESLQEGDILFGTITRTRTIPRDFVFTREQYLSTGGYDQHLKLFEDWDLKIKLAAQNKFYYTGIQGTAYRIHGSGLVQTSPRSSHTRHLWLVFNRHAKLLQWYYRLVAFIIIIMKITRAFTHRLLFGYTRIKQLANLVRNKSQ